jgi:hypothetical protein
VRPKNHPLSQSVTASSSDLYYLKPIVNALPFSPPQLYSGWIGDGQSNPVKVNQGDIAGQGRGGIYANTLK